MSEDRWRLKHVTRHLFSSSMDESLAHCISDDCHMGAGISVMFRKKFWRVRQRLAAALKVCSALN
uniref:Uncharacterized protein n=1 Tax=Fundulus heteroclitus TaxID=8078 RepID=A0A3Q2PTB7_FUNHE